MAVVMLIIPHLPEESVIFFLFKNIFNRTNLRFIKIMSIIQDECSGYTDESKCNRSSNKDGKLCANTMLCVYQE